MPCTASLKAEGTNLAPTGFDTTSLLSLRDAVARVVGRLYRDAPLPQSPVSLTQLKLTERNATIVQRHNEGYTFMEIASEFGISMQRVHQIVRAQL